MGPGRSPKLSASDKQYLRISFLRERRKSSSTLVSDKKAGVSVHPSTVTQCYESKRICRFQEAIIGKRTDITEENLQIKQATAVVLRTSPNVFMMT